MGSRFLTKVSLDVLVMVEAHKFGDAIGFLGLECTGQCTQRNPILQICEAILQIPLSMRKYEYCWAWFHERNGIFTVRSAYRMLIESKKSREDYFEGRANCSNYAARRKEWKKLWSMKLPSKIKVFCWRLVLNTIPTDSVPKNRNMATTAECKICGAAEDTWDHALLNCTMSRCVWAQVDEDLTELIATLRISDPLHWVFFMCGNIPHVVGVRILVICWAIWHARRKAIHEGVFQSPFATIASASRLIEELDIIKGLEQNEKNHNNQKQRARPWIEPKRGQSKINTDTAIARAKCNGAVAAICRGDQGDFIAASVMVIPNIIDPETMEGMACLEALALAEDCGVRRMTVASDCLNVIKKHQ